MSLTLVKVVKISTLKRKIHHNSTQKISFKSPNKNRDFDLFRFKQKNRDFDLIKKSWRSLHWLPIRALVATRKVAISSPQQTHDDIAGIISKSPYGDVAVIPTTNKLTSHWFCPTTRILLPIRYLITYKIALLTFKVRLHCEPRSPYCWLLTVVITMFSKHRCAICTEVQDTTASKAFRVAARRIWTDLSIDIRSSTTLISFYRQLKEASSTMHTINYRRPIHHLQFTSSMDTWIHGHWNGTWEIFFRFTLH